MGSIGIPSKIIGRPFRKNFWNRVVVVMYYTPGHFFEKSATGCLVHHYSYPSAQFVENNTLDQFVENNTLDQFVENYTLDQFVENYTLDQFVENYTLENLYGQFDGNYTLENYMEKGAPSG